MDRYVMIALGGALGAIARYEITNLIQHETHVGFPYGTFVVNVTGCLIIGLAIGLLDQHVITNPSWRLLIVTGFVGAYTTFSTFEYETQRLTELGAGGWAVMNVLTSVVAGFVAVRIGLALGR